MVPPRARRSGQRKGPMAEQYIFTIENLSKVYAKREVLKNIWLAFYPGAKIGVIGSNGAGKSTLLRVMALQEKDFIGSARPADGISIGFVPQEPRLDETKDVKGNIEEAVAGTRALLQRHEDLSAKLAEPLEPDEMEKTLEDLGKAQDAIDAANAWELDRQLEIAMDAMRLPPGDAKATTLSGGERRRVALCKILLERPDLLLLDEPTNHLDAESVAWLERHLQEYPGTVVAITHDRYFLDNVAQWILELDRGQGIPWPGNYTAWLEQKERRLAQEEKEASARRRSLARELEWVRMSPRGRPADDPGRQTGDELARLRRALQLHGPGPAEEGEGPLRRRAEPRAPRQAAAQRRQRAPARRADQRPRRRHAARRGGRARRLRRLRRDRQPRPLDT